MIQVKERPLPDIRTGRYTPHTHPTIPHYTALCCTPCSTTLQLSTARRDGNAALRSRSTGRESEVRTGARAFIHPMHVHTAHLHHPRHTSSCDAAPWSRVTAWSSALANPHIQSDVGGLPMGHRGRRLNRCLTGSAKPCHGDIKQLHM